MTTLVIATRNRHKADEIRAILGASVQGLTLNEFPGAPPLVEDADTFAGNAARKAEQLARWLRTIPSFEFRVSSSNGFVLADDSGLEVDALGCAPGVYSARFAAMDAGAEGNSSDAANNAKLLRLLAEVPMDRRTARFRCALALVSLGPDAKAREARLFEGTCEGRISFAPSGAGGFGYDPLFVPNGFTESFAELGESVKNQLSHRARALAKLREWLERTGATHGVR
ncbi:MAG: non-canonical purine NTP pyrophosphatase [Verrucomicrobia bacterium]|nr:non-canonical purine NTP pyrophosphatase [Verrucomicrobiota bacterium]